MAIMSQKQKPRTFKWRGSEAKNIVLDDLLKGVLPVDANILSAEDAWELTYKYMYEFKDVPFQQFKDRLRDHRKQMKSGLQRSNIEEEALQHDRKLYPRQLKNSKGELVFDLHPAKLLLRKDVAERKHLVMKPMELQETRPECRLFDHCKFKERIYQEVRQVKFINWLEISREKSGVKLQFQFCAASLGMTATAKIQVLSHPFETADCVS